MVTANSDGTLRESLSEDIDLENGMEVALEGNVEHWREGGEISLKPWEVTAVGEGEQAAAIGRLEQELVEGERWLTYHWVAVVVLVLLLPIVLLLWQVL
jgi:hypothetical protein